MDELPSPDRASTLELYDALLKAVEAWAVKRKPTAGPRQLAMEELNALGALSAYCLYGTNSNPGAIQFFLDCVASTLVRGGGDHLTIMAMQTIELEKGEIH